MKTRVTELLGVEKPIIQGGMAWVAESHLAAAVSNAGGFGIIGAANAPAEVVRNYIREAKEMTDKPFGVNIMLMSPYAADIAQVVVEEKVSKKQAKDMQAAIDVVYKEYESKNAGWKWVQK